MQFFFITLVVAERRPALSKIVDEKSRPKLTYVGELTKAALMAVHRIWPGVAISDFVIMPDHVHYLLIANYERDKKTNPLFISHRIADVVEMAVAEGERALADEPVDRMAERFKLAIDSANAQAAANLLKQESGLRFGKLVGDLLEASGDGAAVRGSGARAPVRSVIFARDCYIELSFDSRQLKAIRHYIRLNPARAIWKLRHPDLFLCHRAIKAKRLAPFAPVSFDGIGALPLLGSPFLFHVRLTLKKTVAEHSAAIEDIVDKARRGMVPVSGFISPGEKEALRRLKGEPRARFIKLLPNALPARYDPSAEDSREIAAGRMLILSCFRDTPAISSLDMKRNQSAAHAFRENCLAMNDIGARLCCC